MPHRDSVDLGAAARPASYGRARRWGTGRDHQRPEKRHRGDDSGAAVAARGHDSSMAATMAAASSSVGAGWMSSRE